MQLLQLHLFGKTGLPSLHPSHRPSLRLIIPTLLLLALFQLWIWLVPPPAEAQGLSAYLPLHTLIETAAIVVAMLVFAVGWNAHDRNQSGNIVLLSCAFFAVAWLDFSHTLSYKGMPNFVTASDPEKAINFWLAARFIAATGLLLAVAMPWAPFSSKKVRHWLMATGIAAVVTVNWLILFHQDILPRTFIPGQGLTPFKVNAEYLLVLLNLSTALMLWLRMRTAQPFDAPLLFGAVCVMAMSELFFTLYASVTDVFNVLGHVYKIIAYLLVYKAIVVEAIEAPYRKLDEARQNLALAVSASNTGLWDWNIATGDVRFSPEWKAQLGYLPDELPDRFSTWESRIHPEDREPALKKMQDFLNSTQQDYENEFRMRHRDGSYRWILVRGNKLIDGNGKAIRLTGTHVDISSRKQDEQHIQQLANYDTLTGLPNRLLLNDRVEQAIISAQRSHSRVAVLFVDLDHFKNINDTLGHRIGDGLLVEVGKRLRASVRDQDTVSRMGGDEFVLVLQDSAADGVAHVATKLLSSLAQPYRIDQHELVAPPSIGIAMYPDDGTDFDTLYQHADVAMYRAKQDGRNNFRFFTQEMQLHSTRTLQLENALRQSMPRNQLQLHYQPQYTITDSRMIGVEALLRWHHPDLGMVPPAEFIPIAESSGQIVAIGEWVLRTAAHQLKCWMDSGLPPMVMSVNLSAVQFRHPDLPGLVSQILAETQLPPRYLELELTEGAAMDDPQAAIAVMDDLHTRGVRIAIDDFGTGYSSLSYLKKFKISKLKIDQSFVRDINTDEDDSAIVIAIIQMAQSLGFQTIAEGVETTEQLAFLSEQGCNEVQGYYFSRPLPAVQLEAIAKK
ncbi:MAG: EAL domain-containing protein [Nitrosomonadales bacterium]|nr:EAL domain-containing protein [Nitrosomonadales bacterium]